jgi:Flp pilus assembly secretin CpaC
MYRVLESPMLAWRRLPSPFRYLSYAILVTAVLSIAMANARADSVEVALDQARIMRLPAGVATIVIGNPLIADGSLQAGNLLVVTGKGYGTTNLMALDRGGRVLMDKDITVTGARQADLVTYSCAPQCSPRVTTLGDGMEFFGNTLGQTSARSAAAAAANAGK